MTPEQITAARALELKEFLRGAGAMSGCFFSEIPAGEPRYWWRKELSRITALLDALEAAEAREAALLATNETERQTLIRHNAAHAAQVADLKSSVVAFGAVWAADYAKRAGYAPGELHPTHYGILKDAGARMDDFRRAAIKAGGDA